MTDLQGLADFVDSSVVFFETLSETVSPYLDWLRGNWLTIVLTGEIVGAVIAIKMGRYKRGIGWLAAALVTIWVGGTE